MLLFADPGNPSCRFYEVLGAERLLDDAALTDAQRIERAYLMVLTRRPDGSEVDTALTYIGGLAKQLGKPDAQLTAWQSLCHVLMSTNEFLYLN